MANFREVFKNEHVVLPVIHVRTTEQTITNAKIARDAGADGAFLISMEGMDYIGLRNLHSDVRDELPDFWLGINYLDLTTRWAFLESNEKIEGLWADDAQVNIYNITDYGQAEIDQARRQSKWDGLYFGGVAFKYQSPVDNIAEAAYVARAFMDVITTSGTATGHAPDVLKIKTMKAAIGKHPLAIASGISPENVESFMPYASAFLVATSLMESIEYFNPKRVEALVKAVR